MAEDKLGERHFYDLLKKRDKRAMEFLYDNYAPVLYGVIINSIRNEAVCEEVMTKTFRYIWKNYTEFDPDRQNVCIWILNVARRMCKESVNFKEYINYTSEPGVPAAVDKGNLNITGFPGVISDKKVFDLLFFGNGNISEVARHTGLSETQVKMNLREAVSGLKRTREKV